MPAHPKEENTAGNITDQIAKESADSNASSHALHDEANDKATSGGLAKAEHHAANPGPVMAESVGQQPVAGKEELRKRAEELNKK
ncbi:hypothetical protein MBLNU230_g3481t1 [Neophaeotheca triangularis]